MDKHQTYTYSPLEDPLTIRTVHLKSPAAGDELECTVNYGRLHELNYQCLSYVWGKPEKSHKIIVRDQESGVVMGYIPLTLNLYNALKDSVPNSPPVR